ncbi:hypothetical protein AZE42_10368 [Rhizopogon vesiculosus]|uniref:Uncharacterized protein n=1 Tax=Rhizopogon vesiculosus TaxID=180088 RepID=A0A1J8QK18_9AGAM|nr:hypothetical protein AZE42_10368 [Rhizopogon vesiculosus]
MTTLTTFLNRTAEFPTNCPSGTISDEHIDPSLSQQPVLRCIELGRHISEEEYSPLLQASVGVSGPLLSQHSLDVPPGASGDSNYALSALTPQTFY